MGASASGSKPKQIQLLASLIEKIELRFSQPRELDFIPTESLKQEFDS